VAPSCAAPQGDVFDQLVIALKLACPSESPRQRAKGKGQRAKGHAQGADAIGPKRQQRRRAATRSLRTVCMCAGEQTPPRSACPMHFSNLKICKQKS
jgi:hypothetical protein